MPPEANNEGDVATDTYVPVSEFFSERAVFITGGTGFLGKVLVEKLLRSCPGVKVIYLLMRPKRGLDLEARLAEIVNSPLFERVKKELPSAVNKIIPIQGDISEPDLGISPTDQETLTKNVSVVFHSAATVKFDEPLRVAVQINLLGTKRVVELSRRMEGLKALVHISTCFCNCDLEEIQEVVYPPPYDPDSILQCMEWMNDDLLDHITPTLLGKRPNTYTFTKALTESMFVKEGMGLPITIVRPTIMSSTWKEPVPGWIEGLNGTTGVIAAYGKGIFWSMICDGKKVGDMIPADLVINLIICAAWRTATERSDRMVVYNCCSGARRPLTWNEMFIPIQKTVRSHPSQQILWYPGPKPFCTIKPLHRIKETLLHYLPAYLLDCTRRLANKKPLMVRVQTRVSRGIESTEFFTTHQWRFTDDNTLNLSKSLSKEDQKVFFCDIGCIDWPSYMKDYVLGVREYIHREHPDTIPQSRVLLNRLLWVQRITQILALGLLLRLRSFRALVFYLLSKLLNIFRSVPSLLS